MPGAKLTAEDAEGRRGKKQTRYLPLRASASSAVIPYSDRALHYEMREKPNPVSKNLVLVAQTFLSVLSLLSCLCHHRQEYLCHLKSNPVSKNFGSIGQTAQFVT